MNKNYRIRFVSGDRFVNSNDELMHYGIKGQKWGVRRFQNPDGTYTPAGRERYGISDSLEKKYGREFDRGVKSGKYTDDPEIRELYVMEQMEKRNKGTVKEQAHSDALSEVKRLKKLPDSEEKDKLTSQMLSKIRDYHDEVPEDDADALLDNYEDNRDLFKAQEYEKYFMELIGKNVLYNPEIISDYRPSATRKRQYKTEQLRQKHEELLKAKDASNKYFDRPRAFKNHKTTMKLIDKVDSLREDLFAEIAKSMGIKPTPQNINGLQSIIFE